MGAPANCGEIQVQFPATRGGHVREGLGAAIAFYVVTSIGPVLLIVVAIAGLAFGQDAAQGAIVSQLSGLMGQQSAELLQTTIKSASGKSSGIFASALGVIHTSGDGL